MTTESQDNKKNQFDAVLLEVALFIYLISAIAFSLWVLFRR